MVKKNGTESQNMETADLGLLSSRGGLGLGLGGLGVGVVLSTERSSDGVSDGGVGARVDGGGVASIKVSGGRSGVPSTVHGSRGVRRGSVGGSERIE